MSSFTIKSYQLPVGEVDITLTNDVGSDLLELGSPTIRLGKIKRTVEEAGYGGQLHVPQVDMEIYDLEGSLESTVFASGVSMVQIQINVINGLDTFSAFIGNVDLSTLEFPSYYDSETGTEKHSCRFTAYDILKQLEGYPIGSVRAALDPDKVSYNIAGVLYNASNFSVLAENGTDPSTAGISWSNPFFATTPDGTYSTASLAAGQHSLYLKITNFQFNVPSTHTIKAIQLQVKRLQGAGIGDVQDNSVKLVIGGVVSGTDKALPSSWATGTGEIVTYNPNFEDTWGTSPTYSDINSSTFGVAISAKNPTGLGPALAEIDYVEVTVHAQSSTGGPFYFVKMVDVFKRLQGLTPITIDGTGLENNIAQSFKHILQDGDGETQTGTFDDLYMQYQNADGSYVGLWNDTIDGSFFQERNCFELLVSLAANFLAYPLLVYFPADLDGHLKLKQREAGSALSITPAAPMTSTLTRFYGYDAVKVTDTVKKDGIIFDFESSTEYSVDGTVQQPVWDTFRHKFETITFFRTKRVNLPNQVGDDFEYNFLYLLNGSTMVAVNQVYDEFIDVEPPGPGGGRTTQDRTRNNYLRFLVRAFQRYWNGAELIERKYNRTGIAGPSLELLEKITIGAVDCPIIHHEFDIVNNEMDLKLISY